MIKALRFSKLPRLISVRNGWLVTLLSLLSLWAVADDYSSGHTALEVWDSHAKDNVPLAVAIWLNVMTVTFLSGLVFVWKQPVARWVVGGVLLSVISSGLIADALDLIPLSGYIALIHLLFWTPGLVMLLLRRPFMGPLSAFSIWSGIATLVICVSFIFDGRDAWIYLHHMLF